MQTETKKRKGDANRTRDTTYNIRLNKQREYVRKVTQYPSYLIRRPTWKTRGVLKSTSQKGSSTCNLEHSLTLNSDIEYTTEAEVTTAIRHLKNGKAGAIDNNCIFRRLKVH